MTKRTCTPPMAGTHGQIDTTDPDLPFNDQLFDQLVGGGGAKANAKSVELGCSLNPTHHSNSFGRRGEGPAPWRS
jgi:hypothetical protein